MSKDERKPKRYALNIGVSISSIDHYGSDRMFVAGDRSYHYFKKSFENNKEFEVHTPALNNEAATVDELRKAIRDYSDKMIAGDLLVVTYSGHTYQVSASDTELTNFENKDRGWGMFDRIVFHFELWEMLQQFRAGVQIIVLIDSCYSERMEISSIFDQEESLNAAISTWSNLERSLFNKVKYAINLPTDEIQTIADSTDLKSVDFHNMTEILVQRNEQEEQERKWFTDQENIKEYNKILIRSGKPTLLAIPPAVVIISASGKYDITTDYLINNGSLFSNSFDETLKIDRGAQNDLSTFFDDLSLMTQLRTLYCDWLTNPKEPLKACSPEKMQNRIVPKWHYNEGHRRTKIIDFQFKK